MTDVSRNVQYFRKQKLRKVDSFFPPQFSKQNKKQPCHDLAQPELHLTLKRTHDQVNEPCGGTARGTAERQPKEQLETSKRNSQDEQLRSS